MSIKLMQHVRVVVGVALATMILAILPGVANAETIDGKAGAALNGGDSGGGADKGDGNGGGDSGANLEGKADGALKGDAGTGDGGANLGDTADRVLKSDTTVDSVTDADQQVDLNDQPQVNGDTISNTEVTNPAVPTSGEATADGNVKLDGPVGVNEGVCVSGAVNESGGGCGGGADDSLGDTVTTPDINSNLGDTNADNDTTIDENVNPTNLQQDGTVDNRNDIDAPTVPASGTANLDGNGTVGDTLNQDLNSCTDVNASGCGSADGNAAPDNGGSGTDLSDPLADLGGIDANSDTLTEQQVNENPLQSDGNTTSNTDVDAPAVPASAKAELNGNVTEGDTLNQDVGACGTLNAENCGGESAPDSDAGIDLGDPDVDLGSDADPIILGDNAVDSDTVVDENVALGEQLQQDGMVDNTNNIDAPVVPASGTANLDGNVTEGDAVNQDVSSCSDLNAAGCGGEAAPAPGSSDSVGIDLGEPVGSLGNITADSDTAIDENINLDNLQQDGTVDNTTDVDAPAVPASGTANLNGNAAVDDTLNQGASFCGTLNAEDCGGNTAPAPGSGGPGGIDLDDPLDLDGTTVESATDITENLNPTNLQLDGAVNNRNDIDAPAVPASGTVKTAGNGAVGDTLNQDVNSCTDLNAAGCGNDAAASPDSDAGIDPGEPFANLGANAVPEGSAALGADAALSGDAATPAGSDDVLSSDAEATLSGDAALGSDAEPSSLNGNATLSGDVIFSGDIDTTPARDDAVTTISDGAALNGSAGSAPAGSDTVPASDDTPITLSDFVSDEVDTPLTGGVATLPKGDSGTSFNSDAGTAPAGENDEGPGRLALANTDTETAAVPSGEPASTADPSDDRTQNLTAGPSKSGFRTLAGNPLSGRSVALSAGPSGGEGKASASSGSATKSGDRLLDTGGVSPLVLIVALLFVGFGTLLVTRRRRFSS